MKIEEIAFIIGLLLIPFMYLFASKLILKKQALFYLFILSIMLSIIAIFQANSHTNARPNFYLFLFCPIYDLAILYPSLLLFKKIKKRNPKQAPRQFFPNDDGLWLDRIYNFTLLILWLVLPIGLLAYLYK